MHGIRIFADLVPGALLDLEPGTTAALLELERLWQVGRSTSRCHSASSGSLSR